MSAPALDRYVKPYAKALVGFLAPGAVAVAAAVTEASHGGSTVTGAEWLGALAACFVTAGAVWAVPNTDPRGVRQAESVQPPTN